MTIRREVQTVGRGYYYTTCNLLRLHVIIMFFTCQSVLHAVLFFCKRNCSKTTAQNFQKLCIILGIRTQGVDVHITRKFHFHHFSWNFGTFEFELSYAVKTKVQICIFAESFDVMIFQELDPFIELFWVFQTYPDIQNHISTFKVTFKISNLQQNTIKLNFFKQVILFICTVVIQIQ